VQKSEIDTAEEGMTTKTLKESMKIIQYSTINDFTVTGCGWKV
jgi:hypothetical protein